MSLSTDDGDLEVSLADHAGDVHGAAERAVAADHE